MAAALSTALAAVLAFALASVVVPDLYTRVIDRQLRGNPKPRITTYPVDFIVRQVRGRGWLIPGTPLELGPVTTTSDSVAWCIDHDGIPSERGVASLSITAQSGTINILGVEPVVVSRHSAPAGSYVPMWGAGDMYTKALYIDLDAEKPVAEPYEGDDSGAWEFPVSIGDADTLVTTLVSKSWEGLVEWRVDVRFVDPAIGAVNTQRFPPEHDPPFRTTSATGAKAYWRWKPATDGTGDLSPSHWVNEPPELLR